MQVFLIRHPRPFLDLGICYGRLDIQAEDPQPVAARLKPLLPEGTTFFSSPLQRARLLAEALDPETRIDARLSEMDFGEWEGQPWDAIDRDALDAWAADTLQMCIRDRHITSATCIIFFIIVFICVIKKINF